MDYAERRFQVFRAGNHTDSAGNERTWTPADLDHIASSYSPGQHEAPVVIGHPKDNSPAYGWVRGLQHQDGTLYATADLLPEFEELLKRGLFKKRSISLYEDGTLRHIGFLGAQPPAIKGLADIQFSEGDATTIEFSDPNPSKGGTSMKFFEWIKQLAGEKGVTIDDLPQGQASFMEETRIDVQPVIEQARKEERDKLTAEFAEAGKKREDELKAREDKIRAKELEARKAGITSFCEDLQKKGILTPAIMSLGMGMTNFLESIAAIETPIEFGEGEGKAKQTPLEFMQAFLMGLPKAIEFKEVATGDKDVGKGDEAKRKKAISDYCETHKNATDKEALLAVSKAHPELFADR